MTPSRFTMPGNRFYPSIGEYCATDQEYMQKVDAIRRQEDREVLPQNEGEG